LAFKNKTLEINSYGNVKMPAPSNLRIIVTNNLGSEAFTLGETFYSRGSDIINLEGLGFSPGIYHVTLATAKRRVTQKVVIAW
jgi:hypothetical protein